MTGKQKYNAGPINVVRTSDEVDEVLNAVAVKIDQGRSRFPRMTYEEGVRAAIDWLKGDIDDSPIED
jgi:hypothetical protein